MGQVTAGRVPARGVRLDLPDGCLAHQPVPHPAEPGRVVRQPDLVAEKPTDEQQAIIDAYGTDANLVIEAGAGTGKTTTLKMLGMQRPGRKGVYIAYNRAIAHDAKKDFPADVQCATAHSFAFGAVGRQFAHRLKAARVPAWEAARLHLDDEDGEQPEIRRDEAMLAYVAVTRARQILDRAGLAWVDKYL